MKKGEEKMAHYMYKDYKPVDYAKMACDTMMRKFKAEDLPPKGRFHYHQGVFLSGVQKTYDLCKDEKYYHYIKDWVDSIIDVKGEIHTFDPGQLDDIQPGILLFFLFGKTGERRYKIALNTLLPCIMNTKRNAEGGLWHKESCPDQMWLDGLYMAGPISAEYAFRFHKEEYLNLAIEQALLMEKKTRDEKTGLWYHAYDCSRKMPWADKETGLAPEFWGRSIGWVPVAIMDELEFVPKNRPEYKELGRLVHDLLTAVIRYQDEESGLWYQVVDKGGQEGNWLETSCTCLFSAAIAKAVRTGLLEKSNLAYARKGFEGVIDRLKWDGDDLLVDNICIGTGVGNYEHYCKRPTSTNDLHGMGAFLIMCAEIEEIAMRLNK